MASVAVESREASDLANSVEMTSFSMPTEQTKIYKDECVYCFHTPFFPEGLFVCLQSFGCFCRRHVTQYAESSGNKLFLQIESKKISIEMETDETGEPKDKVTRLAIGVDSGFDTKKFELHDDYHVVMYPELHRRAKVVPELSDDLFRVCQHVISSVSAERLEMLQNASNAWDGELKQVTKHADLEQLDNGKKVPLCGWKCEEEGCDLAENLWLNLTDGAIRCGRSQYVAEGEKSLGNNHMKMYFDATGFPLVVKLGTIAKDGSGDVFSYTEDDAVIDPNLEKHLAHFGLDPAQLEKTEKSTLELELDMNQKWEWAKCQEDGASLESIFGPGYTGLINIGSSCYMNSVLQSLLLVPDFRRRFAADSAHLTPPINQLPPNQIHGDFNSEVWKLFSAMMSGDYAQDGSSMNGISPKQFKRVVAGAHPEFSTAKQQDAEEYARHLLDKISTNTPAGAEDPSMALRFQLETRFEDVASGGVRYGEQDETILSLPVRESLLKPLDGEENKGRFSAKMSSLLEAAFAADVIDDFKSPVTGEAKGATTTIRFKTFPDFLLVRIQKFTLTPEYTVKKIDMDLEVDDLLDLSSLRGVGIQPSEHLLPEGAESVARPAALPDFDPNVAQQLEQMGFSHNASMKAAMEVKPANGSAEVALEWLMVRLDDPSINDAPVAPVAPPTNKTAAAERPSVQQLVSFGFSVHQACHALERFPDPNAAAEWLFEHAHEVPAEETVTAETKQPAVKEMRDGEGKYRLVGLISHMGSSPHSGHYVAHMYKEGKWILFNDEKVAVSQNPPKQLAYLYLYQRI